jgi:arsenate reductase
MDLPASRDDILLLHNPKCSKSRQTLALLEERGVEFATRLYLEEPLAADELSELGNRLGKPLLEFTRTKQAEFSEAGLTNQSDAGEILAAMVATPILLERPVVIRGNRAVIGRPPEDVLALLDD